MSGATLATLGGVVMRPETWEQVRALLVFGAIVGGPAEAEAERIICYETGAPRSYAQRAIQALNEGHEPFAVSVDEDDAEPGYIIEVLAKVSDVTPDGAA